MQIAVGSDRLWRAFAPAFGLDRARSGRPTAQRVGDRDAVIAAVNAAFAAYPRGRPAARSSTELGIPAGKVRTIDEVYEWDQTRRRAC